MARAAGNSDTQRIRPQTAVLLVVTAVVTAVAGVVLHPVVTVPLAGLALATLVIGRRGRMAVLATGLAGLLSGLSSLMVYPAVVVPLVGVPLTARTPYVYGMLTAASLVLAGPVTVALMRRRSALFTAAVVAMAISVLQVGALALLAEGAGLSLQAYVSDAIAGMVALGAGLADVETSVVMLWPGVAVALNGFTAVLLTAGASVIAAGRGAPGNRFPAIATIDLHPLLVVPGIVAIALLAAERLPIEAAPVLGAIGKNTLVVIRWVFFLQGVAVFAALFERGRVGRSFRSFGYMVLGVIEIMFPLVSLIGFTDVWLNIRRLPRENARDGAVETPPDRH